MTKNRTQKKTETVQMSLNSPHYIYVVNCNGLKCYVNDESSSLIASIS